MKKIYKWKDNQLVSSEFKSSDWSFTATRIPLTGHLRRKFKIKRPSKKYRHAWFIIVLHGCHTAAVYKTVRCYRSAGSK